MASKVSIEEFEGKKFKITTFEPEREGV